MFCPALGDSISSKQAEMLQFSLQNIPGCGKNYKWRGCHSCKLAPISQRFLLKNKSGIIALHKKKAGLEK